MTSVFEQLSTIIEQNQRLAETEPTLEQYYAMKAVAECSWVNQINSLQRLGGGIGVLPAFMTPGIKQTTASRQQTQGNSKR